MLSDYELLRQRNMAENERILTALGLATKSECNLVVPPAPQVHMQQPRVAQRWQTCESRLASLRPLRNAEEAVVVNKYLAPRPRRTSFMEASNRLVKKSTSFNVLLHPGSSAERAIGTVERQRAAPRKKANYSAGQRGGWNAQTHTIVGTAVVSESARNGTPSTYRRVPIRKRADGRKYGYVGRTQIAFRAGQFFPCCMSGVHVVSYAEGEAESEVEDVPLDVA